MGTESPPLSNEEERREVAYHEAGHALVATLTPGADPVFKVSIIPRGQALGVAFLMPTDRRSRSRTHLLTSMRVGLGGRAAEQVAFNEIFTGAEHDLRVVTSLARRMVAQFGMSEALGPLNFGDHETQPFLGYTLTQECMYSEETAAKIDAEVRRMVEEAYDQTVKLLRSHRDKLDALAEELLTQEVVDRERLLEIAGVDRARVEVEPQEA
jgi:cell division protease FtsH